MIFPAFGRLGIPGFSASSVPKAILTDGFLTGLRLEADNFPIKLMNKQDHDEN